MTQQIAWPTDSEWIVCPDAHEVAMERRYWADLDAIAEYDAYTELRAQLESFTSWPLEDLIEELELVRILTPDQEDLMLEIATEIERRSEPVDLADSEPSTHEDDCACDECENERRENDAEYQQLWWEYERMTRGA